jgi:hypothetical protein
MINRGRAPVIERPAAKITARRTATSQRSHIMIEANHQLANFISAGAGKQTIMADMAGFTNQTAWLTRQSSVVVITACP